MCMTESDIRCQVSGIRQKGEAEYLLASTFLAHFVVDGVHASFHLGGEVLEVVLVRHAGGVDRIEDAHRRISRVEDLRTGLVHPVGAFDDDGEEGESCVDGDAEGALVEGKQLAFHAAGALWIDEQGIPPLSGYLHAVNDRLARRAAVLTVDLDYPDGPHRLSHEGDSEDLLLREVPTMQRERPEEKGDVVLGEMVRCDDVPLVRVDLLEPLDRHPNRWNVQEKERPKLHDVVMGRRCGSERPVHDDEGGDEKRENKEERYKDECPEAGEQSAEHGR